MNAVPRRNSVGRENSHGTSRRGECSTPPQRGLSTGSALGMEVPSRNQSTSPTETNLGRLSRSNRNGSNVQHNGRDSREDRSSDHQQSAPAIQRGRTQTQFQGRHVVPANRSLPALENRPDNREVCYVLIISINFQVIFRITV